MQSHFIYPNTGHMRLMETGDPILKEEASAHCCPLKRRENVVPFIPGFFAQGRVKHLSSASFYNFILLGVFSMLQSHSSQMGVPTCLKHLMERIKAGRPTENV